MIHGPDLRMPLFQYVFVTESVAGSKQKSVHEELAKNLKATLRPTQADQLVIGKFLKHSWFFFDVLIKSMAQHLLCTGRIKVGVLPLCFTLRIDKGSLGGALHLGTCIFDHGSCNGISYKL